MIRQLHDIYKLQGKTADVPEEGLTFLSEVEKQHHLFWWQSRLSSWYQSREVAYDTTWYHIHYMSDKNILNNNILNSCDIQ